MPTQRSSVASSASNSAAPAAWTTVPWSRTTARWAYRNASASVVKNDSNVGIVNGLTVYSTGAFGLDEIRVGTTFADVTPVVPEPGVMLVLPLGAMALSARRGRACR